eukprot:4092933-Pyramimonas_sp.AAC.1
MPPPCKHQRAHLNLAYGTGVGFRSVAKGTGAQASRTSGPVYRSSVQDQCVQDQCAGPVYRTSVQDQCAGPVCRTSVQDQCAGPVYSGPVYSGPVYSGPVYRTRVAHQCARPVDQCTVDQSGAPVYRTSGAVYSRPVYRTRVAHLPSE